MGISEKLKELPSEASGGQVERACIARALFLNPKIIIADEPTSSLDEENTNNVLHLLDQIRVQYNITIIVSSHNRLTANFATQLLFIKDQSIYDVRNS